ncbi:MAG TPA: glycosyl hydrolase family 18 protein [Terriglobales bacterium]|nr:glycosyl hydrolase family 18 protein [Terriglobales bacterium]
MRYLHRLAIATAIVAVLAGSAFAEKRVSAKAAAKPRITTLMYMVNRPAAIESFRANAKQISIIAPQSFSMDAEGFVGGEVPAAVLEIARENKVALMPLVVNRGFNQDLMHTVLDTPASRARVIRYLLYYALRDGYIGFQFDYENIKYTYRDRFTVFFKEAAREFHRHGLLLTAAVVGKYSDDRNSESPGGFENWSGVYDYRALAKHADFLSIMAYPQHAGFSGPGPLAGVPWVGKIVDFTLSNMPASKISLGVPTYGIRWTAIDPATAKKADFVQDNEGTTVKKWKTSTAAWPEVLPALLKTNTPQWDATEEAHFLEFNSDCSQPQPTPVAQRNGSAECQPGARNVVWYEDAKSLSPKLKLATDKKLGWGISAWVLGMEDPEFWTMLANEYRVVHPKTPAVRGTYEQRAKAAAKRVSLRKVEVTAATEAGM